jgi:hypothetical protein
MATSLQLIAPEAIAPFVEYVEGERYYESPRLPLPVRGGVAECGHDTIVTDGNTTEDYTPEFIHTSSATMFEVQSEKSFLSLGSFVRGPVSRKKR